MKLAALALVTLALGIALGFVLRGGAFEAQAGDDEDEAESVPIQTGLPSKQFVLADQVSLAADEVWDSGYVDVSGCSLWILRFRWSVASPDNSVVTNISADGIADDENTKSLTLETIDAKRQKVINNENVGFAPFYRFQRTNGPTPQTLSAFFYCTGP